MQTELTLVAEVQVAFLTLKRKRNYGRTLFLRHVYYLATGLKGHHMVLGKKLKQDINIYNVSVVIIQVIYSVTQ